MPFPFNYIIYTSLKTVVFLCRPRHLQLCGLLTFCRWCVLQFLNELHELSHRLEQTEQTQTKHIFDLIRSEFNGDLNVGPRLGWKDLKKLSW